MDPSLEHSWEEHAFAKDASRSLGGRCVWPPRSYSCSFCRREFRSAQALGGHMNVHKRDRARARLFKHDDDQSLTPPTDEAVVVPRVHALDPLNYDTNPAEVLASPPLISHHVIRVSSPPAAMNDIDDDEDLNLLVSRKGTSTALSSDEELKVVSWKRRRLVEAKPLMSRTRNIDHTSVICQYSLLKLRSGPVDQEELDLELRLGTDAPKLKQPANL